MISTAVCEVVPQHPKGTKARVLLTSVFGPYARDDEFGYRWMVLSDPDMEDLVVGLNAVSTEIQGGGYGDRLLAAVFSFRDDKNRKAYWIYNFKRGAFYPFVPVANHKRDSERELQLQGKLEQELPIEAELERWYPLWDAPV